MLNYNRLSKLYLAATLLLNVFIITPPSDLSAQDNIPFKLPPESELI